MRGKALKTRRERNRELAAQDAANRCNQCKRALGPRRLVDLASGHKFCDRECFADYFAGFPRTGRA